MVHWSGAIEGGWSEVSCSRSPSCWQLSGPAQHDMSVSAGIASPDDGQILAASLPRARNIMLTAALRSEISASIWASWSDSISAHAQSNNSGPGGSDNSNAWDGEI